MNTTKANELKTYLEQKLQEAQSTRAEADPTVSPWAKTETKPTYTAAEVGALANTVTIPQKTSDITNDLDFISYTTTVPTADTDVPTIVILTSEPPQRYKGWLYFIQSS